MDHFKLQNLSENFSKLQLQHQKPPPLMPPKPLSFQGNMAKNFDLFAQGWWDYCKAIGADYWPLECNAAKVSLLLAFSGERVRSYKFSAKELESPETTLRAIKVRVVGKRNVVADLGVFFEAKQGPQESIDAYTARLKRLVAQILESDLITYKIVTSSRWPHLRTKMQANANITLDEALTLCRAEENQGPKVNKTKRFRKYYQNKPPIDSNRATQGKPVATARHGNNPTHFLETDFKLEDLNKWIAGFVTSEDGTSNESLSSALMEYKTEEIDEAWLDKFVNLIFEKAVSKPHDSKGCANWAKELSSSLKGIAKADRGTFSFKSRLLALCQKEFETRCADRIKQRLVDDQGKIEPEESDEEKRKMHSRAVGTVRFIGELYNVGGLLTSSIMHSVIKLLIEKDDNKYDEETLECLCKILTIIGPKMEKDQDLTKYFCRLDEIAGSTEQNLLCDEVRSMVQEVIDLHRNGWEAV